MLPRIAGRRRIAPLLLAVAGIAAPVMTPVGPRPAMAQRTDPSSGPFVGNRNSKVFHATTCGVLGRTSPTSKIEIPNARVASANGFRPCGTCKPLSDPGSAPVATVAMVSSPAARPRQDDDPASAPPGGDELRFSRDIAPVLVGNCIGCHNPEDKARRNNLDLTTFRGLMAGGDGGPAIVASDPSESLLIRRVKGIGVPKMPPGDRDLAPETIARLERWVEQGGRLDAGIEPGAELTSYAASPEELRRAELADLSPEEADARVREVGLDRWGRASSEEPEVTTSGRIMLFARLPEDRAEGLRKQLNAQAAATVQLLGPAAGGALGGPAKLSVFVFGDRIAYAEFVRSIESREVEAGGVATANLADDFPYLAAVDPASGAGEADVAAADKGAATPGARSLAALLTEPLVAEATRRAGNPPRWLSLGLGAYLAQRLDPRSPEYARVRLLALEIIRRGGLIRAQELIGGQGDEASIRALGFSLLEWIGTAYRPTFTPFVRAMLADGSKFDDVIEKGYGAGREEFLNAWAAWAARSYARRR